MLLYTLSSYRASTKQSSNWHALSEGEKKGGKMVFHVLRNPLQIMAGIVNSRKFDTDLVLPHCQGESPLAVLLKFSNIGGYMVTLC